MNAGKWATRTLIAFALIPFVLWLGLFWRIFLYSFFDDTEQANAIVVLADVKKGDSPSSLYRARLDRAAELYSGGYAPLIFVASVTQKEGADVSGEMGARYLRRAGIPEASVIPVPHSENVFRAVQLADYEVRQYTGETDVSLFVSHDFHNLRIITTARGIGMPTVISPVKTQHLLVKLYRTFIESFRYIAHVIQVS